MAIAYVNGEFVPLEEARISVLDRGFLFADAVYEVIGVLDGRLIDNEAHEARLARSLAELAIAQPMPMSELAAVEAELVRRNGVFEGALYLQVTRGIGGRNFTFPDDLVPSVVMFAESRDLIALEGVERGLRVITVPDIRWHRRDIKTVQLVAQALAKQQAKRAGADEAWMVEDGFVTEGGSSNAFIVTEGDAVVTRRADSSILSGTTRKAILALVREAGLTFEERPFSIEEAFGAKEAFLTSTTNFVMPVVRIDDRDVAGGKPGPLSRRLRGLYIEFARSALSPTEA